MTEEPSERATAPATLAEWQAALKASANAIMQADSKPAKSGSIAGALVASSTGRGYDHNDVLHAPHSGTHVLVSTSKDRAVTLAEKLLALNLPGIESIEVVPYGEGDRAEVRILPYPKPAR
ncbi:MAG TPA: hypothetical protein VJM32_02690 [Candidatus Saccharimonadales bacterium]|nr:hypothetical protein [Candidatus Saccharimonadales bacterium]